MSDAETDAAVLARCFAAAKVHPFYRDRFGCAAGPDDAPATEKKALLERLEGFRPDAEGGNVYLVRSGGSTTSPLIFPVDIGENKAQRRALCERLLADGMFGPETVALNLFGYADLYRTAAIVDDLLERCRATTLPMSAHARYEDVLAVSRRFGPSHVLGTPSKLGLFARFLADAGETLRVPQLLYAGELLRPGARTLLAETFGSSRIWSLYGGAESGIWAWCDVTRRPDLFRVLPGIVVEVLAPDAAGFGPLAVTNGFRMRFPVFRYCVGDVGRFVEVGGERLLELRGRDSRSFQLFELTHDLDRIAALAAGAEGFQLQLRTGEDRRENAALLLVDERGACAPEEVAAALSTLLQAPPTSGAVEVRRVAREALFQDPATSKTPPIADFRR